MLLAVQRQVVFIALVHVHAGNIVQRPFVLDNVVRGNVGTVIDTEHDCFLCLRRHSIDFIPGKLPEVRLHGRKGDSFLSAVPVFVRNVLNALYIYFLVFQLHAFLDTPLGWILKSIAAMNTVN